MNISDIVKYCLDAFKWCHLNSVNSLFLIVLYIILNCRQRPLMSYDDGKLWNKKKSIMYINASDIKALI